MLAYWDVIRDVTPRHICDACEYAARGNLGDPKFMPSAGELYQCAQAFEQRERPARHTLPELEARNNPQTRAHIISGFKKLLADLRGGVPIDPDKATNAVFHPEPPDYSVEPPTVSTGLRKQLDEFCND